jgi:hypothetical protein
MAPKPFKQITVYTPYTYKKEREKKIVERARLLLDDSSESVKL